MELEQCNDIVTWLRTRQGGVRFPVQLRIFLSYLQNLSEVNPASYSVGIGVLTRGKEIGSEADHLPLSSAKVTNEGSYTSALPVCLHCVDRDTFSFFFNLQLLLRMN